MMIAMIMIMIDDDDSNYDDDDCDDDYDSDNLTAMGIHSITSHSRYHLGFHCRVICREKQFLYYDLEHINETAKKTLLHYCERISFSKRADVIEESTDFCRNITTAWQIFKCTFKPWLGIY